MMVTDPGALPLRGNDLAVDFANTVADVRTGEGEFLLNARDLARWAHHAGALDARELKAVLASIEANPTGAAKHCRRALEFRAALTRIFMRKGRAEDIARLDTERVRGAAGYVLSRGMHSYSLRWKPPISLEVVLARIAAAASTLVTSDGFAKVKQCDGPQCGWMFVDESRTRARRWCSMQDCGNRAKVRRFRDRLPD
jgi:predicted RNA-binding Zn ribbon-like protein